MIVAGFILESRVSCEVEGDKKNKEFNLLYFNRSTFDS